VVGCEKNQADVVQRLRGWQVEALAAYRDALASGSSRDFLVTATPGAGKTTFALTAAKRMLDARQVSKVIIVAPTDHLRTQWAEAGHRMGLSFDPSLANNGGLIAPDFHGCVVTYAQVAAHPVVHERRTSKQRTLVILDEVHHAGDGLSWGQAVEFAFGAATQRLLLTGTPFRTKAGETIPFVRYTDDGDGNLVSEADYTYAYKNALSDHVVRPVMFAAYSGVARWQNCAGDVIAANLSEDLTQTQETQAWRTVLKPDGRWIPHVVTAADHRLSEIRAAGMSDAGAMLLASDQDDARAYADVVESITGHRPVVVLSDDPKASQRIEAFSNGTERWLIAVRMVSEGVDIPRLAVGVWATSYRTPLFFAQAVGRFVRARRPGETATVFLPAVRPLLALAADIEDQRNMVLTPMKKGQDLDLMDLPAPERGENEEGDGFQALDAEAEFAHVLFAGAAHTGDAPLPLSDDDEDYLGLPGLLSPEQTATLLKQREVQLRRTVREQGEPQVKTVRADERMASLRQEISRLVHRVASRTGTPHAKVHADLRRVVPGPPSAQAPLDVLEKRRDHLLSRT
jgi:superfamily II DNA or RNA helicase